MLKTNHSELNMKKVQFYKKLTIANLLNWFAMRSFRIGRAFCGQLVLRAIALDPSRRIFKDNLAALGIPYRPVSEKKPLSKNLPFHSIPEGCRLLAQKIKMFDTNQVIKLSLPKVINKDFCVSEKYICEVRLPDTYLAELNNVMAFAGTDLILTQGLALYDEIDRHNTKFYAIKSPLLKKILPNHLVLKMPKTYGKNIDRGIHFSKDHSKNYFHWIIECLPRLSLVQDLDKDIPLLVDEDLPPQALEAFVALNIDDRPIIKIQRDKIYRIKKLYYPSPLSIIHDNYNLPNHQKDVAYSQTGILFVREAALKKLTYPHTQQRRRKIYISRKNSDYRQLLNSTEIEEFLVTKGFEIIFPENLSFFAQLQIFSQAEIIIGQSGAGMANFIFAPKDCKVLMMVSDVPQTNFHLFGSLAQVVGINFELLIGKSAYAPKKYTIHADFSIDLAILSNYLGEV